MCQQSLSFPLHPSQLPAVLQGQPGAVSLQQPCRLHAASRFGEQLWAESRAVMPFAQMLADNKAGFLSSGVNCSIF